MKTAGIIFLIVGLLMTLYTGFTYVTKEKVVDLGSLEVTKDDEHTVNWQPYVGSEPSSLEVQFLCLAEKEC
jgi:hypothetical protein